MPSVGSVEMQQKADLYGGEGGILLWETVSQKPVSSPVECGCNGREAGRILQWETAVGDCRGQG